MNPLSETFSLSLVKLLRGIHIHIHIHVKKLTQNRRIDYNKKILEDMQETKNVKQNANTASNLHAIFYFARYTNRLL